MALYRYRYRYIQISTSISIYICMYVFVLVCVCVCVYKAGDGTQGLVHARQVSTTEPYPQPLLGFKGHKGKDTTIP
jgi:hypothetical protein